MYYLNIITISLIITLAFGKQCPNGRYPTGKLNDEDANELLTSTLNKIVENGGPKYDPIRISNANEESNCKATLVYQIDAQLRDGQSNIRGCEIDIKKKNWETRNKVQTSASVACDGQRRIVRSYVGE